MDTLGGKGVLVPPLVIEPLTTTRTPITAAPEAGNHNGNSPDGEDRESRFVGVKQARQRWGYKDDSGKQAQEESLENEVPFAVLSQCFLLVKRASHVVRR